MGGAFDLDVGLADSGRQLEEAAVAASSPTEAIYQQQVLATVPHARFGSGY
jgi:hypothetical protein